MFPNYIVKLVLSTLIHKVGVDDFTQFLSDLFKDMDQNGDRKIDMLDAYSAIDRFVDKHLNK